MKLAPTKSTKEYLIWVVSFALLIGLGVDAGNGLRTPFKHLRQTELTLSKSTRKVRKGSNLFTLFTAKPAYNFSLALSLPSIINRHTLTTELKWKYSKKHLISTAPKIGQGHNKTTLNTDEDPSLPQG